ncbi:MAG: Soluble Starch synthase III (IC) [Candidatus Uhrbacteria bacterium GW2011_GWD2_52_7]|uniref:Soluble Starch synthase III (IC) n=1 Tax=Candidatus Uhrbacteria bacterium GW2011_GWD2_52_7 TaxID=1618989 RepID=A0A0G1XIL3_9BACT|nr:MAG: Soluble Starch synthase III (IC) [Candidatus Uhrbacteria bacterium GW2011_GWD2_52_7]
MKKQQGQHTDPSLEDRLDKVRSQLDGGINSVDGVLSKIERLLGKKKTLKADEQNKLSNLDAMIGSLEREVGNYGDALTAQQKVIADLRRRYNDALEQVTGGAPVAPLPEKAAAKKQEAAPEEGAATKIVQEFQKELRKVLGDYGNLRGDIRKGHVSRADALEALEAFEKAWDDIGVNWEASKVIIERGEVSERERAMMALVETQLFDIKTQHERTLAEAEKLTDAPEDEPQAETVRRIDEASEARLVNLANEAKKTLESIEESLKQLETEREQMRPDQLRSRIEGILGVIHRTGSNWARVEGDFYDGDTGAIRTKWQEIEGYGVRVQQQAQTLYESLPPESESDRADRLVRGMVNARNTWKPEYEGQANAKGRWGIVEKYVREGMTFAELEQYFLNARALEGVTKRLDELAPVYKGVLEARDQERAKEREKKVRPMSAIELITNDRIWKPEVAEKDRWDLLRDFARNEPTIDRIVDYTKDEEAGAVFLENAARLKQERADRCEQAINELPSQIAPITQELEVFKAQTDESLSLQDIARVDEKFQKLVELFVSSLKFLIDIQAPEDVTDGAAAVRAQLKAVEGELDTLFRRVKQEETPYGEDPAEKMLEDIVGNESIWREVSVDARRQIVREEIEGRLRTRDFKRAVKDIAVFRGNIGPFREYLDKRGLLDLVAPKVQFEGMSHEARIARLEDLIEKQFNRIVAADLWRDGVTEADRRALLSEDAIKSVDDIITLKDKTVPYWARSVQTSARRLVELRQSLAKAKRMAARSQAGEDTSAEEQEMNLAEQAGHESVQTTGEVQEASGDASTVVVKESNAAEAGAAEISGVVEVRIDSVPDVSRREKAIADHRTEILTLLSGDFLWEPWFANGDVGSRKTAIARMLKTGVLPKREHLKDIELFKIVSAFRDIEDLRSMIARVNPASSVESAAVIPRAETPVAATAEQVAAQTGSTEPEARFSEERRTAASQAPVMPVRRAPPSVAAVPAPVEAVVPPRVSSVTRPSPEVKPAVVSPSVEAVPQPVQAAPVEKPRRATEAVKNVSSLSPERYFEQDRASRFRLVDDDDETEDAPMNAAENTSRLATQTVGWFGRMRERLFGKKEKEPVREAQLGQQAQAAGGAIATMGRIFGFSAFRGVTDRVAGVSAAERRVLEGAVKRAAALEVSQRSPEAALERREMANKEAFERLARSIDASSKPQAEKRAMQERLTKARAAYEANVAADREERDREVAQAIERASREVQPSLQARGSAFVRERDAKQFTDTFGETMRERRDLNVVARVFEAFRRGFAEEWTRQANARQTPLSEALRTLGDKAGVEPATGSVDDATLMASVGGEAAARVSQQRIQSDVDALIATLERKS